MNVKHIPSDLEREEDGCGEIVDHEPFPEGCVLVHPTLSPPKSSTTRSKGDLAALSGFCPVALASGQGFVIPGNPRLGLVRFAGSHYACSTASRAQQFGQNPSLLLAAVDRIVKENPCLEHLLRYAPVEEGESKRTASRSSNPTQTPVHMVESRQDPSYKWNEWDLRRDALNMARMASGSLHSHSVQTETSAYRREATAQSGGLLIANPRLERSTQTARDCKTSTDSTHRKKSIVVGLKSRKGTAVEHVLLEDLLASI